MIPCFHGAKHARKMLWDSCTAADGTSEVNTHVIKHPRCIVHGCCSDALHPAASPSRGPFLSPVAFTISTENVCVAIRPSPSHRVVSLLLVTFTCNSWASNRCQIGLDLTLNSTGKRRLLIGLLHTRPESGPSRPKGKKPSDPVEESSTKVVGYPRRRWRICRLSTEREDGGGAGFGQSASVNPFPPDLDPGGRDST